jgi:hypothetical protein
MSPHPPGVLKSIVYGNLQQFWKQNMHRSIAASQQ